MEFEDTPTGYRVIDGAGRVSLHLSKAAADQYAVKWHGIVQPLHAPIEKEKPDDTRPAP